MGKNNKKVFTVLCIDGGGVRGLIPARILQEIEERTGKPASELFDLIGGPSTGAIVAAGLSVPDPDEPTKPKFSAEELKNFYYKHTPEIFPKVRFALLHQLSSGAVYDPEPLEKALELAFGDLKMKDALNHLMLPATDIKKFRPVWINNHKGMKDPSPEGWSTMLIKDAVRACTTAPLYFPAKYYTTTPNEDMPNVTYRHALIDGGFFAGSVLHQLLSQAKRIAPPDAEIVMVHVGTGALDNSLSPEEFNRLGLRGLTSKSNGSIMMSLVVNMSVIDSSENLRGEMGKNFIELDGKMPFDEGPMAMDDADPKSLRRLEQFAEEIIAREQEDLERLYEILRRRDQYGAYRLDSREAMESLSSLLQKTENAEDLTALHARITHYMDEPDDVAAVEGEEPLKELAQKLMLEDKATLDSAYQARLREFKGKSDNTVGKFFKKAGDGMRNLFNKISGKDDKKDPPKNDADNNNPPPAAPKL